MADCCLTVSGGAQVGRTTLLATYLMGLGSETAWIDREVSQGEPAYQRVLADWNRIRRSAPMPPTSESMVDLVVTGTSGRRVQFRDCRRDGAPLGPEDGDEDPPTHAILFVITQEPSQLDRAMETLRAAAATEAPGSHARTAVAVSKADRFLAPEDPAWEAELGWWRAHFPEHGDLQALIDRFGDRVWPVSSYGFHGDEPAVLWSEFGHLLPFDVRPRNVHRPFESLLESLDYR